MINFGYITKENIKGYNPNWFQIANNSYQMLVIGESRSRKLNVLFNI